MSSSLPSICVFTERATTGFHALMKGIAFAARERGWSVRTVELDRLKVGVQDILRAWQPIGSLSYNLSPDAFPKRSVCIHINPKVAASGAWTVRHDSRLTGEMAAQEMLKLAGRTYAYVGDPTKALWSQVRGEHFAGTLARFDFGCAVFDGVRTPDDPLREQQALRSWILSLERPCAVFAANDKTAEIVLAAALDAGLAVPDDVAILGVDDDANLCENAPVTLSSIMPDFFHGAMLGCALLHRRISDPKFRSSAATFYGDIGVTVRASTRLQLKQSALVTQMREYIRLHAAEGISATDVINETGRQRRGVELVFRAATGKTIGEELQNARIELAQRALADESIQIGEIPSLVGYVSQNQLERLFKRSFGMTMRDYRRTRILCSPRNPLLQPRS